MFIGLGNSWFQTILTLVHPTQEWMDQTTNFFHAAVPWTATGIREPDFSIICILVSGMIKRATLVGLAFANRKGQFVLSHLALKKIHLRIVSVGALCALRQQVCTVIQNSTSAKPSVVNMVWGSLVSAVIFVPLMMHL